MTQLADESFLKMFGFNGSGEEFVTSFHDAVRLGFFFHPRNQKDFFLNLLGKTQSEDSMLSEAQDVVENRFETLGSGKTYLGETINWQRDFKSGKVWDLQPPSRLDIMDLQNPSDVKVPWELSRFHQVWWLGKAYWLTHDERYALKFVELVESWIANNPPGLGVNWAVAMEVAIRAANWIAAYYLFCESKSIPPRFWISFFKSLYVHGVFIDNHLEYSWRNGNHLLSNLAGLVMLGIFFKNSKFGSDWLARGKAILEKEMLEQVSPDGVDYEKSTSYQRLVAELFYTPVVLCLRNRVEFSPVFMKRLERMMEFTQTYLRPDGSIPLFGDADDGRLYRFSMKDDINDHRHVLSVGAILFKRGDFKVAAGKFHQDSLWLFGSEGFEQHQMLREGTTSTGSRSFPEGGFYILRGEDTHLMVDAGEIGMGGMGGHGHNDTLSFEFWIHGEPLIVDSGTYAYSFDVAARQEFRGSKSHNTVVVDGKEIAKFVGLWMILNDATKPRVFEWSTSPTKDILKAAHYAYTTLPSPVVHTRRYELDKSNGHLEITDELEGEGQHLVESYLHFAPSVRLQIENPGIVIAVNKEMRYSITSSKGVFSNFESWYSRSYGIRERKNTLVLHLKDLLPQKVILKISKL